MLHSRAAKHLGKSTGIPAVSREFPQIGGEFPQIGGEFPQIGGEFPQIRPEFPQIRPEFPQIGGGFVPQIRREFPPQIRRGFPLSADLERKSQQNRRKIPRACPRCSTNAWYMPQARGVF